MPIIIGSFLLFSGLAPQAAPESLASFGKTPDPKWLETQPSTVFADGSGLPVGSGTPEQGANIYSEQCAGCHGANGEGGSALELVGDRALLTTEYPDRGIAVYWPYAPPLFSYVQRAMPPDNPFSLSNDETYAVVAQLLRLNNLVAAEQIVDARFLSELVMPNRDGFNSLIEH